MFCRNIFIIDESIELLWPLIIEKSLMSIRAKRKK